MSLSDHIRSVLSSVRYLCPHSSIFMKHAHTHIYISSKDYILFLNLSYFVILIHRPNLI